MIVGFLLLLLPQATATISAARGAHTHGAAEQEQSCSQPAEQEHRKRRASLLAALSDERRPTSAEVLSPWASQLGYTTPSGSRASIFWGHHAHQNGTIYKRLPQLQVRFEREISTLADDQTRDRHVARLLRDGLRWNPLGVDVTTVLHVRTMDPRCSKNNTQDIGMLFSAVRASVEGMPGLHAGASLVHKLYYEHDQPSRVCMLPGAASSDASSATGSMDGNVHHSRHQCRSGECKSLLHGLRSDGFALVDSWGVDMNALRTEALHALQHRNYTDPKPSRRTPGIILSYAPIHALDRLLNRTSVATAISQYFGGVPARYDGHVVLSLAGPSQKLYHAGQWHHDRCGKRLKLWIYVNDVDMASMPTAIARGTHNFMWHNHNEAMAPNRFSDQYMRDNHKIAHMTQRAGGGYIFDTNALHKADLDLRDASARDPSPRVAVILEFHPHAKIQAVLGSPAAQWMGPCPSRPADAYKQHFPTAGKIGWAAAKRYGISGYPLYPPESPAR